MANPEHLAILKQGVEVWNRWREEHPEIQPDLRWAHLGGSHLNGVNFRHADLREAHIGRAYLNHADFFDADLYGANFHGSDLRGANLCRARLFETVFSQALLCEADLSEAGCQVYAKRFRIETLFSDQKSRGFHIHKSHMSDPERLSRLLIAACLAYIWIVYLGILCLKEEWIEILHRRHRCDLSLFQLGLRLLDHFLNESLPVPVQFHISD